MHFRNNLPSSTRKTGTISFNFAGFLSSSSTVMAVSKQIISSKQESVHYNRFSAWRPLESRLKEAHP